jgi:ABC-type multidrug transport system permease subunit
MKTIVKAIVVFLLFINGIGTFYGGSQLITDPTGTKIQMIFLRMFYAPMHATFLVIGACLIG